MTHETLNTPQRTSRQASPRGIKWFQSARFGMFVHWGLYSIIARQEWVMHLERIPVSEYEKLMTQFNPTKFNADEWVSIAADAGQKYIVITSRHHEGFSMYDTALSDYKVTNTPFNRDPIAELATACAKRTDVKLGFYSSLLDWHHPAYRFREESGMAWSDYIGFLHGQVRELCTNYGEIMTLWFDGDWPRHPIDETNAYFKAGGSFEYDALYDLIHTLQPDAVVHNNHHTTPLPGEDIQGFEQDLPGNNSAGFNTTEISGLPLEVCMTLNDHWGYCATDQNHKTTRYLIHLLARSASVGANYLLNVGPTALGEILPAHVTRLKELGLWLTKNGEGIYGTNAGVIPFADGVSTKKGNKHFLHVLHYNSECVFLKNLSNIKNRDGLSASLLSNNQPLAIELDKNQISICIPSELRDSNNTVIVLNDSP
jgi:alpha-L-fucosidase